MSKLLNSQGSALVKGVNAFEPYIYQLQNEYENDQFIDWPSIVLVNTIQASAISIFKLLPPADLSDEVLDKRSIASLVRNIVETHDVLRMMVGLTDPDLFNLHRDILGLYIFSRLAKVQKQIDAANAEETPPAMKNRYWKSIQASRYYDNRLKKVKDGENIFYDTRRERVEAVCGDHSEKVLGILADLSTYVHSIPPALWFTKIDQLYADSLPNRDMTAVWLQIANFYIGQSYKRVVQSAGYHCSSDLKEYLNRFETVFAES